MKARFAILGLSAATLAALSACGVADRGDNWRDQLIADSPCFEVNLLDGLDEQTTHEVRSLFDCVNYHGHLEPLVPLVLTQDANTRDGVNPGIELARTVNAMPEVDVDPFAIAGLLMNALQAEDRPIDEFLNIGLELIYGERAANVRSGVVPLQSADHLGSGVLVPLAPVLPRITGALLDDDLAAAAWFGELLAHPETKRWVRTFEAYVTSDDPAISKPLAGVIGHLGDALDAAQSQENDRWPLQSSGNSLRDLMEIYFLQEDPILARISDEAAIIVSDEAFRASLQPALVSLHDDGHLGKLPAQLLWMASVDTNKQPIGQAEASSLYRFIRLLSATNKPIDCELDFILFTPQFSFPNLAVAILNLLAEMDPDAVQGAAGIVSTLTDNLVADWMLHQAVDLEICPDLTHQVVDDLRAIDAITGDESYSLLVTIVELLDVMKNQSDTNQIPVVADLLNQLHDAGGTKPLEELVIDLGDQSLLVDIFDLVPALADPVGAGILSERLQDPVELQDAIGLMEWAFVIDPDKGQTGLEEMRPLLVAMLDPDETWQALANAGELMADDQTQIHKLMDIIPPLLAIDPELEILDQLGPLLGQERIARPLMRMIEADGLASSLLAVEPEGDSEWVPLAFVGRMIVNGTLDDLLSLVDLVLGDVE